MGLGGTETSLRVSENKAFILNPRYGVAYRTISAVRFSNGAANG